MKGKWDEWGLLTDGEYDSIVFKELCDFTLLDLVKTSICSHKIFPVVKETPLWGSVLLLAQNPPKNKTKRKVFIRCLSRAIQFNVDDPKIFSFIVIYGNFFTSSSYFHLESFFASLILWVSNYPDFFGENKKFNGNLFQSNPIVLLWSFFKILFSFFVFFVKMSDKSCRKVL